MIKIDLITGFLGSGKTTFIRKYAGHMMEKGMNIGILENDFGAVNVDMMLLQDLEGDLCELEMVAGGCDIDCHRRRFKTKLIAMGMCGYNRVLVEPSGIFDVDEFFDALHEEPLDNWYEVGSVIVIVDSQLEEELSEQSEYLLASQLACAGKVVLSKTAQASEADLERTLEHMNRALERFGCGRTFAREDVLVKDWEKLEAKDYEELMQAGSVSEDHVKLQVESENTFESVYFMNLKITPEALQEKAERLMADPECGNVFRMKGFLPSGDGWLELNATRRKIRLAPIPKGQEILIVIGENLREEHIREILEKA